MRSRNDAGSEVLEMCSSHILGAAQVLIAGVEATGGRYFQVTAQARWSTCRLGFRRTRSLAGSTSNERARLRGKTLSRDCKNAVVRIAARDSDESARPFGTREIIVGLPVQRASERLWLPVGDTRDPARRRCKPRSESLRSVVGARGPAHLRPDVLMTNG